MSAIHNYIFVHSCLDDYGLCPAEFRLLGHLARREGPDGAYPSIARMAKVCRLHPQTIRKTLHTLRQKRFIHLQTRLGETHLIHLRPTDEWLPPATPPSASPTSPAKRIHPHPSETDAAKDTPIEINPKKERPPAPSQFIDSNSSAKATNRRPASHDRNDRYPRKSRPPAKPARSFDPANYHQDISKL